jgi:hypothetical protein
VNCHQKEYAATTTPNHAAAGFPTACEACHKPSDVAFSQARFDHNASFPLTGPHQTTQCASCHKNNVFKGTSSQCASCHQPDFARAQEPNHVAAGFPTTCELCHRPNAPTWRAPGSTSFSHATYPLVGLHTQQTCSSCHKNNQFAGTPRDCVGCHRPAYERTTTPNHVAAGFPTTCESCHRPSEPGWRSSGGFNHNQFFPLVGQHTSQTCVSCHKNNVFKGTARDCIGCHRTNYERHHAEPCPGGFPDHVRTATGPRIELEQRQLQPQPGVRPGRPARHGRVCDLPQEQRVQGHGTRLCRVSPPGIRPHHHAQPRAGRLPHHLRELPSVERPDVAECQLQSQPGVPAGRQTRGGGLRRVPREWGVQGHGARVYRCHRTGVRPQTTPNHASAGFSTTCETCHRASDQTWRGVTFNHNSFFPLQGIHALQSCATCHKNNVYKGTARDCVGCHKARYDATRSPNHVQSGFPTTCDSCHRAGDTNWNQGRFSHTRFPLTGRHNVACVQCHTTNAPPAFNCLVCHGRSETDSEHRGKAGYRYESAACYSCHPNGKGD